MNLPTAYTRIAIILHWLVALAVFCALPLGMYMHELPLSPTKLQLYSYHKWLGISVLLLVAVRLAWRIGHRPPPLLPGMPRWQEIAAHATLNFTMLALILVHAAAAIKHHLFDHDGTLARMLPFLKTGPRA